MNNPLPAALRSQLVLRVLARAAVAFLLLGGFVKLAGEIAEGETQAFDEWLVRLLRSADISDPIGPAWLEEVARDVTALGGNTVLGLLLVACTLYLVLRRHRRTAAVLFSSVALGYLAAYALKLGFDRPRPELVPHRQVVYTSSFPSGHAMGSALTYLTLAALLARVEKRRVVKAFLLGVALFVTGLVGVSRIYLGVHYPTDVVGGWGVGAAWAVLTGLAVETLGAGQRASAPPPPR